MRFDIHGLKLIAAMTMLAGATTLLHAEPLSFDLVRRAFLKEYGRRFDQYTRSGGKQGPYPLISCCRCTVFTIPDS